MTVPDTIPLSPSARNAVGRFGGGENIMAWALVKEILGAHSEYGGGLGGKLFGESGPPKGPSQPIDKWLSDLNELFDPQRVPELHGRLVILGLSRIDPDLHAYLSSYTFIQSLEGELHEPFQSLLRDRSATAKPDPTQNVVEADLGETTPVGADQMTDTVEQALARASAIAQATTGQVDSIILLAVLLAAGLSQTQPKAAGLLVSALDRQKNFTPPGSPDAHIVELLQLNARYGIHDLPSVSEHAGPPAPFALEVERVLDGTVRLAGQVSEKIYISNRRVLATLLAPNFVLPVPQVQPYLRSLGFNLHELRVDLLEFIRENYPGERLDEWQQVLLTSDYVPPAAGYISDSVLGEDPDRLNIGQEVANIAYVITSKLVKPPLSIGLFGDWGSGKSFFMDKLGKFVNDIAAYYQTEEHQTGLPARWCSRVVQIKFNAWHYSDANLWASSPSIVNLRI